MSFRITEDNELAKSEVFLNGLALVPNEICRRVFYVSKVVESKTVTESKFYRFYIKDVNGITYIARQFNICSGDDLRKLSNQICIADLSLEVLEAGDRQFTIEGIQPVGDIEGLDTSIFMGEYSERGHKLKECKEYLQDLTTGTKYALLNKAIEANNYLTELYNLSSEGLAGGQLGVPIKIISKGLQVINTLESNQDTKAIASLEFSLCTAIHLINSNKRSNSILSSSSKGLRNLESILNKVIKASPDTDKEFWQDFQEDCLHCWECITNVSQPKTVTANLVKATYNSTMSHEGFSFLSERLNKGSSVAYNGSEIVKMF